MDMIAGLEGSLLFIVFLTLLGFGMIIVDLLVIPGTVLLVAGSGIILWSVWLDYKEFGLIPAAIHLAICLAITPKLIMTSLRRLSLNQEMNKDDGYIGVVDRSAYVGLKGTARSTLRPSGSVSIMVDGDEEYLDCISEGGMIEKGAEVVIVEDRGTSLVVRRASELV